MGRPSPTPPVRYYATTAIKTGGTHPRAAFWEYRAVIIDADSDIIAEFARRHPRRLAVFQRIVDQIGQAPLERDAAQRQGQIFRESGV